MNYNLLTIYQYQVTTYEFIKSLAITSIPENRFNTNIDTTIDTIMEIDDGK
jgi:hypothetical protein